MFSAGSNPEPQNGVAKELKSTFLSFMRDWNIHISTEEA